LNTRRHSQQKHNNTPSLPKIIWLLWFQGWDDAPPLVLDVARAWKLYNPNWTIIYLSHSTLQFYIPDTVPYKVPGNTMLAAQSDIVRLTLMTSYGGVWADATLPPMVPLDNWVTQAIKPAGIWMYHGRDSGRGPASWFMVSVPNSYIMTQWMKSTVNLWNSSASADYFWMDMLFADLAKSDAEFLRQWLLVPYLTCEDYGSSHALAGKTDGYDPDLLEYMKNNPPFVVKLSRHSGYNEKSNAYELLKHILNYKNDQQLYVKWNSSLEHKDVEGARFFP